MKKFNAFISLACLTLIIWSPIAHAATLPSAIRQAVVWVHCGHRQGSGVVIHANPGYVLTNAHILLDLKSMTPEPCEIAFPHPQTFTPNIFYYATPDHYVYDESRNQDFAVLKIGHPQDAATVDPFPIVKTDEFSKVDDTLSVLSYPSKAQGQQFLTDGTIQGLEQGIIKTNAEISPGSSGGAGLDVNNNLIGLATRILYIETSPGVQELVDYELVDIRAVLTWLDTFGTDLHDSYITHADPDRYHQPTQLVDTQSLSCSLLVRTSLATTVYCLKNDGTRRVFPNNETYHSWIADFSTVISVAPQDLASYKLSGVITMKPGTLVKIPTDPKVYLVTDRQGTLRWLQTETHAKELYGDGWAGFVKDVPIEFFATYHVGNPISE